MTVAERQDIFAKEVLTINDFMKLYEIEYNTASKLLCDMKRKLTIGQGKELRLEMSGKIHVLDYLDYIGATSSRYNIQEGSYGKQQETCAS